jgi:hypothetical protein
LTGGGVASDGAPGAQGAWGPAAEPLARFLFAVLVVACFAAFFLTQRLKHTPTVVQRFERTPTFVPTSADPEKRQERISFKVSHADTVTVTVIDAKGNAVATLVRNQPVARYKQFSLRWNGRTGPARRHEELTSGSGHRTLVPQNTGRLAPPGEYRVRVTLRRQGGEVLSPWSFTLLAQAAARR